MRFPPEKLSRPHRDARVIWRPVRNTDVRFGCCDLRIPPRTRIESCAMVLLRLDRKGAVLKMKAADKHFRSSCLKDKLRPFLHWVLESGPFGPFLKKLRGLHPRLTTLLTRKSKVRRTSFCG